MIKLIQFFSARANATILKPNGARSFLVCHLSSGNTTSVTASADGNIHEHDSPIEIANPYEKEKQFCILCKYNIIPHYKNVKLLSQFQSPYTGRTYGRHITGLCKKKQEEVEKAIIRAQHSALMPIYHKDPAFLQEPSLFDPERPIRPHKYWSPIPWYYTYSSYTLAFGM